MTLATAPIFDRASDKLRASLNANIERIRSRAELTPAARRGLIAAATKKAKAEMAALEAATDEAKSANRMKNERTAFGIDDLASTPAERATLSMAYRAATDMVANIDDPREASRLLTHATATGDETLARALAKKADSMFAFSGYKSDVDPWFGVVNEYVATHPKAVDAIDALHFDAVHSPQADELFQFVVPTPSEVEGANDGRLDAMIAEIPPGVIA